MGNHEGHLCLPLVPLSNSCIMCMTLLLSEPMIQAVVNGACHLEFTNFTECVVTYVVKRTRMRFSGVISTAVLQYVEISSETRLSVYVPHLCLGLLVMMVNGWLLVSLQSETSSPGRRTVVSHAGRRRRRGPIRYIVFSLTIAHCLHGAITLYIMTSMVASSATSNIRYRNQAVECLTMNSFLFMAIFSAVFHHVTLVCERFHCIKYSVSYRMFWTSSKSWTLVGSIWSMALILAMLPLMGWRTDFPYCIFFYQYPKGYFTLVVNVYFVSLAVICCGYAFIFLATRKPHGVTFKSKCSQVRRRQESELTVTVAILAAISAILWTPLFLHLVLACPQCLARNDDEFILLGVFAFVLTNALLFPLIYACRIKQLKYVVAAIVKQCEMCNIKRKSGSFELRMRQRRTNKRQYPQRSSTSVMMEPQGLSWQPDLPLSGSGNGDILY